MWTAIESTGLGVAATMIKGIVTKTCGPAVVLAALAWIAAGDAWAAPREKESVRKCKAACEDTFGRCKKKPEDPHCFGNWKACYGKCGAK
jgi:hypothetical protein